MLLPDFIPNTGCLNWRSEIVACPEMHTVQVGFKFMLSHRGSLNTSDIITNNLGLHMLLMMTQTVT